MTSPPPIVTPGAGVRDAGPTALAVHDLTVHYGPKMALDHVSAELPERRVTALIGPPGAASRRSCAA
jgi:phosphate transport system ATP-binding protein